MLQFNQKGFLTPHTIIQSSVVELEEEFVKNIPSQLRKEIFAKYIIYCKALNEACHNKPFIQWINGSFTTKKAEPGDIDIVSFIDHSVLGNSLKLFEQFAYPNSEINYQVDAYIVPVFPERHKLHFLFISDRLDWLDRFNKTWLNRAGKRYAKDFLEINW